MLAAIQLVGLLIATYTGWRFLEALDDSPSRTMTRIVAAVAVLATLWLVFALLTLGADDATG